MSIISHDANNYEHESDRESVSWPAAERNVEDQIQKALGWLRILIAEDQVAELRALAVETEQFGFRTLSGYFDGEHLETMAREAMEFSETAKGVYFTLNPLHRQVLQRCPNRVELARSGSSASSDDVISRRWLLIDVDRGQRGENSASDAEKEKVRHTILAIRDFLTNQGWPAPIFADSANGYHLLYRIDLPVDDRGLVRRVLAALSHRFSTVDAEVDTKVADPVRVVKLYGTMARKGPDTPERPHRRSQILEIPSEIQIVGRDLLDNLAGESPSEGGPTLMGRRAHTVLTPGSSIAERARAYLLKVPPAISGQGGHDQAYSAACKLVLGFNLTPQEAFPILGEWNQRCQPPWTERELWHKLEDADQEPGERGNLLDDATNETADDPHRLARVFLRHQYASREGWTLRNWREDWFEWDGACYRELPLAELRAYLCTAIKQEFDRINRQQAGNARKVRRSVSEPAPGGEAPTSPAGERPASKGKDELPPKTLKVTRALVENVLQAVAAETVLSGRTVPPAWLDDGNDYRADEMLPARNGLVHLPSLTEGKDFLLAATPSFFTTNALDYEVTATAAAPCQWIEFLGQLWPDDPDSIATLQEWFGYCLTRDTTQQKILFILGPKRSGKGTIARVMKGLLGEANVAGPTLCSLATNFGLMHLLNRPLAIISDARLSGKTDQAIITERLLAISGEDLQTVDRKNRSPVSCKLPTRFMILSNEMPRLNDASTALPSRLLVLRLTNTWYDKEDPTLTGRLLNELPGIFLWAAEGLGRLQKRGRFLQPATGQEIHRGMIELSSPITTFVEECCELAPDSITTKAWLFKKWSDWCEDRGHHAGSVGTFTRDLQAAFTAIRAGRPGGDGPRPRTFTGISLRRDADMPPEEREAVVREAHFDALERTRGRHRVQARPGTCQNGPGDGSQDVA